MRLAALAILLALCLCQIGSPQRIAVGGSVSASPSMGYEAPTLGVWGQYRQDRLRVFAEVDNSRKAWLLNGMSWRSSASLDSSSWRGLSALAVGGVRQHRNSEWVKTGWWWGGGARWRGLYSYYSPADSSPNRVRSFITGVEVIGDGRVAPYFGAEYGRYWFCCTTSDIGWTFTVRGGVSIGK